MKKLATLLVSTALVGGLALIAVAPAGAAEVAARSMPGGNGPGQQMMQQAPDGQGFGPRSMRGSGMQGPGDGQRLGVGLFRLACSANGAPRLEIALNNLSERLKLSDEQKTLYDAFKTSALTAETSYADACQAPTADAKTPPNPVEALKLFATNASARITAIDAVLPALETFYNSLSDEQKAEFAGPRGQMHMGQGNFGPGQGRGPGPDQDGFGPGMGWGNGPGDADGANR